MYFVKSKGAQNHEAYDVFLGGGGRGGQRICYVTFSNKMKYSVDLALKSKIDFL